MVVSVVLYIASKKTYRYEGEVMRERSMLSNGWLFVTIHMHTIISLVHQLLISFIRLGKGLGYTGKYLMLYQHVINMVIITCLYDHFSIIPAIDRIFLVIFDRLFIAESGTYLYMLKTHTTYAHLVNPIQ